MPVGRIIDAGGMIENDNANCCAVMLTLDADPCGSLAPDALFLLIAVTAQVDASSAVLGEPLGQTDGEHALLGVAEFDCVSKSLQFNIGVDNVLIKAWNETSQPFPQPADHYCLC